MSKREYGSLVINLVSLSLAIFSLCSWQLSIVNSFSALATLLFAVSCLLMLFGVLAKKKINDVAFGIVLFKYIATVLEATCLMALLIVDIPSNMSVISYGESLKLYFMDIRGILRYALLPLLSVIVFVFFEGDRRLNKKKTMYYPVALIGIYGIFVLALSFIEKTPVPYLFMDIEVLPVYMVVLCCIVVLLISYLAARYILLNNQIRAPRIKLKR